MNQFGFTNVVSDFLEPPRKIMEPPKTSAPPFSEIDHYGRFQFDQFDQSACVSESEPKVMPADRAMAGDKRGREELPIEGGSGDAAGSSKRGRGGTTGKVVFECTLAVRPARRPAT